MKVLLYVPLVYFVGVDGFVMFTPYVALVMSAAYLLRRFRPEPQPARVRA